MEDSNHPAALWRWAMAVFCVVLAFQWGLIRGAGTDIPVYDQWDVEGRYFYPIIKEGNLRSADWLRPTNENRILWTLLLDHSLFSLNGQRWDPLVQLTVNAVLRAACALAIAALLSAGFGWRGRSVVAAGVTIAFLPHLAWHNALWGIESHAYFVLGLSICALALLQPPRRSLRQTIAGVVIGMCALLAMSPGALVPIPLLGLVALRAIERRKIDLTAFAEAVPALLLLLTAWLFRVHVPQHDALHASTVVEFLVAAARALAWPHVGSPWAAVALNLPIIIAVSGRLGRQRNALEGEDLVLLLAGWSIAVAFAIGWARGGSDELFAGVPSRYVDFLVLLPIANTWLAIQLARSITRERRSVAIASTAAWGLFLALGWLGLSAETMRRIIVPRFQDRDAPVRLAVAFQQSRDPAVFAGQPRLLVPHPNPQVVHAVLNDTRMQGSLPPSLQPDLPMGPLSRAVRWLLQR